MKLRIQGNSLRIRVTRPDLEQLRREQRLVDVLDLGGGSRFEYTLEIVAGDDLDASLDAGALHVRLPSRLAQPWYDDAEVGVRGIKALEGGDELVILIEKDFECLIPREGEDQSDHFPNPARA